MRFAVNLSFIFVLEFFLWGNSATSFGEAYTGKNLFLKTKRKVGFHG